MIVESYINIFFKDDNIYRIYTNTKIKKDGIIYDVKILLDDKNEFINVQRICIGEEF